MSKPTAGSRSALPLPSPPPEDPLFAEWAAYWLASCVHLKVKTLAGYESLLRAHVVPAFGERRLSEMRPIEVRAWIAALQRSGLSPSRTRQSHYVLSHSLRTAVELGYLEKSPCVGTPLPRIPRSEIDVLTAPQLEAFARAMHPRYRDLVYVLGFGGLRWGEMAGLRWGRVDFDRARLTIRESLAEVAGRLYFGVPKTHKHRVVRLPSFLTERLRAQAERTKPDPTDLVFTTERGLPLRHGNFLRDFWKPALAAAGLPAGVRPHGLRHTAASLLISQGASVKLVQAQLGHSRVDVTLETYAHLFDQDLDQMATALDAIHAASLT